MKNLMVVDGCQNYGFDIHRVYDDDFQQMMPGADCDVAFIEDIYKREDYDALFPAFQRMWYGRVGNASVEGIDGLLFYENLDRKAGYQDGRADCVPISSFDRAIPDADLKHIVLFDADPSRKICPYGIEASVFDVLFPEPHMNIAFAERLPGDKASISSLMKELKRAPIRLKDVRKISGILYMGYSEWIDKYPLRNDAEMPRHYPMSE